jgi:20S proteasome subunit alpha 1
MMQATSAGMKEQEAVNFLEKKMKENPAFTYDETVQVIMDNPSLF